MKKVLFVAVLGMVVSLILASCTAPTTATHSSNNIPASKVEVGRWGFNKTPGEFLLEVEKGQEVEITFVYGDNDVPENNPHIISVPDYDIETDILDRDNQEVTVRFTATETGEVAFMCTSPECIGHHNLHTIV